jgi:preprotein translocase subunit SecD
MAFKAAATGVKVYVLQQRPIVQGQDIPFDAATQNIKMSDDILCSFQSEGGEIFSELRNTTGAAISVTGKAEWL